MERASRDIRFDEVLADACAEDRSKYCEVSEDQGSGGIRLRRRPNFRSIDQEQEMEDFFLGNEDPSFMYSIIHPSLTTT